MSNFPPGVTGNEFAISGPDREWEQLPDGPCSSCELLYPDLVIWQGYGYEKWWICPFCEETNDVIEDPFEFESEGWDDRDDDYDESDWDGEY